MNIQPHFSLLNDIPNFSSLEKTQVPGLDREMQEIKEALQKLLQDIKGLRDQLEGASHMNIKMCNNEITMKSGLK